MRVFGRRITSLITFAENVAKSIEAIDEISRNIDAIQSLCRTQSIYVIVIGLHVVSVVESQKTVSAIEPKSLRSGGSNPSCQISIRIADPERPSSPGLGGQWFDDGDTDLLESFEFGVRVIYLDLDRITSVACPFPWNPEPFSPCRCS